MEDRGSGRLCCDVCAWRKEFSRSALVVDSGSAAVKDGGEECSGGVTGETVFVESSLGTGSFRCGTIILMGSGSIMRDRGCKTEKKEEREEQGRHKRIEVNLVRCST